MEKQVFQKKKKKKGNALEKGETGDFASITESQHGNLSNGKRRKIFPDRWFFD